VDCSFSEAGAERSERQNSDLRDLSPFVFNFGLGNVMSMSNFAVRCSGESNLCQLWAVEMQHGLNWLPMNIQTETMILVLLVLTQSGDMSLSRQFNSQNL
jgi:hypothetical protein